MDNFFNYDPKTIRDSMLAAVEKELGEPLYPGDERRAFIDSCASLIIGQYAKLNEVAKQNSLTYGRGQVLDAYAERFGLARSPGAKATVTLNVEFSSHENALTISQGTRFFYGNLAFEARNTQLVPASNVQHVVSVVCDAENVGTKYNGIELNSSFSIASELESFISSSSGNVSNGGSAPEEYTEAGDAHFRDRIRAGKNSGRLAATKGSYVNAVMLFNSDVIDCYVSDDDPGFVVIKPLLKSKESSGGRVPNSTEVVALREHLLSDEVKPIGDRISVAYPNAYEIGMDLTLYCKKENIENISNCYEKIISKYEEWQCRKLGKAFDRMYLYKLFLEAGVDHIGLNFDYSEIEEQDGLYSSIDQDCFWYIGDMNITVSEFDG